MLSFEQTLLSNRYSQREDHRDLCANSSNLLIEFVIGFQRFSVFPTIGSNVGYQPLTY